MTNRYGDAVEPIAIVGIGCRLPGGVTGRALLWNLLEGGVDAIGGIPADRWDADQYYSPKSQQPGRMNAREGGFLGSVDTFDAAFFGISSRIAEQMDPQQRLLLEVSWETFEDAGITPGSLTSDRVGVFVGASSQDYGGLQTAPSELEGMGAHSATGTFMSILSNRLSYTFDFHGPSMTIDTACSSSLVAVHLACQSLRRGESDVALAGGVNVMLTPQFAIALSQASMLSPDGRSKAFDAAANGYVRGEGAGAVVLKPLTKAQLDNDRIYAVIRGTAVNQDGRTQGITLPSGAAQEINFRAALAEARVTPADIGYVEAHGTGTPVGDPIEANALGRVLAADRQPDEVAYIGSIKTNVGHLEAGAGIAGLLKAALAVHNRKIPPSLHFHTPNPEIDFARWRLVVPTTTQPWPSHYSRAVASVNSFGFGGTNANVVLEEAPAHPGTTGSARTSGAPTVLTLSARSEAALKVLAAKSVEWLETQPQPIDLEQLGGNLALRRSHHNHRLAVVTSDAPDAATKLRGYLDDGTAPGIVASQAKKGAGGKLAFLFNGQGPQWYAMGRGLLATSEVFLAKVMECDSIARRYLGWSIYAALTAPDQESSRIHETHCLQPTMFAIQVALAELWKSWGIEPDGVAGHSMGEIAAAHVAGSLSLDEALKVICHRSRIQEKADATGGMMFVAAGKEEALAFCAEYPDELWLSAENSPHATTLSGRRPVLEKLASVLGDRGVFARILAVNCACHSQDMDPLREELLAALDGVQGSETVIPMYSTVTGAHIDGNELATPYWWRNFRQPVLFAPAIRAMLADGFDTFIELSPHPVLVNSLREVLAEAGSDAVAVSSLVRKKDDWECFLDAFGTLYSAGRGVAWRQRYPGNPSVMDLPANPWIKESFWNESEVSHRYRAGGQAHPMLKRVDAVRPTWEIKWDDHRLAWVKDHKVFGSVIVPGASYVEAALAAAQELTGEPCALEFLEFERACVLGDDPVVSRIELDPDAGRFEIHNRSVRSGSWTRNVHGRFYRKSAGAEPAPAFELGAIRARCTSAFDSIALYGVLNDADYTYGPAFCGLDRFLVGEREGLARVTVPRVLKNRQEGYLLHPAVLDACFQSAILHPAEDRPGALLPFSYLPTGIDQVRLYGAPRPPVWCYTRVAKLDAAELCVDIYVLDEQGLLIAEYRRLRGKVVRYRATTSGNPIENHLYRPVWRANPLTSTGLPARSTAVTVSPSDLGIRLEPVCAALSGRLGAQTNGNGYQADVGRLCGAYVVGCLTEFGQELAVGDTFSVSDFAGLLPKYQRAFAGYLRFLVDDGILSEQAGVHRVERAPELDARQLWARAFAAHPARAWELLLLRETGSRLHQVLVGDVDPLTLLFPDGSRDETEPIYDSSPIARFYNLVVKRALEQIAHASDRRRTLRVLEVGGGTGGLTANVLPALPRDQSEYLFTDVSAAFVDGARERFREYDFVDYRTLDLEHDPWDQGLTPGSFDVVLAADVIHATTDVKKTLLHIQEALAPGGLLVMVEAAPGNRWLDLTFGLTAGWWAFRDLQLRPQGPLLSAADWKKALSSAGFDDVAALTDPGDDGAGTQTVLLARAPETPAPAAGDHAAVRCAGEPERLGDWVIAGAPAELGAELARHIRDRGGRAITVGAAEDKDYDKLFASLDPQGVILLWETASGTDPVSEGCERSVSVVDLIQALNRRSLKVWPRLFMLTRGAHGFRNDEVHLESASAWGLGLVAGLEIPDAEFTMIDLDATPESGEAAQVWAELWATDHEREVALRAGQRFTRRLVSLPADETAEPVPASELPDGTGFTLEIAAPGTLDELRYRATERVAPAPGQVELEIVAAGLNFLDVMTALGQVPPLQSARGFRFGAECAGIVTRVGDGVTALDVGDPVVAVSSAQGALASHLVVDAANVVPKPESLSFEEAASVPIVFLTAWFALHKLARVEAGERVLIHSAAGGTGLAAVQLARLTGAEVFATAGSPQKRALLRSLGVRHVLDSRSLDFADEVLAATDGQGVDVVLNAIAGESVARSIACLAPYGRFVEIGKRDLLGDRNLGLRPFLRNLAYFSFDLRQTIVDRPLIVQAELEHLMKLFGEQQLRPLPHRVYHPSQTEAAFRRLAAAKHIGKLVVAMDERDVRVRPSDRRSQLEMRDTWLITGGLGGVGLTMADELAAAGVRHLVLVGRSGVPDEQTQARVDALRERGVEVIADAVDVTSRTQLAALLERIDRELPPLRGILHCAMVLDDALLVELNSERLTRVLEPKAAGAWYLHELTADLPLDAFVLFSSATSLIGNRGQANYAAANAFLDQLAEARRAGGRPAIALNLGAVSDVGYVARHGDIERMVAATGMRGFTAPEAFGVLQSLANGSHPQVGVLPMDWQQFFRHHGLSPESQPRYAELFNEHFDAEQGGADLAAGRTLREQLASRTAEARGELLRTELKVRVAGVLGIPIAELDEDMPLMDYLDSLLAVEISAWLERELGTKVTIMDLMKGPSVAQLAEGLLPQLADSAS